MKKITSNWLLISLAFVVGLFSACSKDDDKAVLPVFPSAQTISIAANDSKDFSFDANMSWKLSSSATWLKFEKDGVEEFSLSGVAGKQTVKIKATNENLGNEDSKATLALTMGNQTETIAEVVRSAIENKITIYDADGKEISAIEVGYNDYIEFSVEANFEFAAISKPEWVKFEGGSLTGNANVKVKSGAEFDNETVSEKYPIEASDKNVIVFANSAGTISFSVPVFFAGMDAREIDILDNVAWNWTVDLDGVSFVQTIQSEDPVTFEDGVPFTIVTLNDDYKAVYAEMSNDQYWLTDENGEAVSWLKLVDKNKDGNVVVEVEKFVPADWGPTSRTGTILVFPAAVYEEAIA